MSLGDKACIEKIIEKLIKKVEKRQHSASENPKKHPTNSRRRIKAGGMAASGSSADWTNRLRLGTDRQGMVAKSLADGELERNTEVVLIEGELFPDHHKALDDANYKGQIPFLYDEKFKEVVDKETSEIKKISVFSRKCLAVDAIECEGSGTYADLSFDEKMDLFRSIDQYYTEKYMSSAKHVFRKGTQVQCADTGRYWSGRVEASLCDERGDIYYLMDFKDSEASDPTYHYGHRVRHHVEQSALPKTVLANKFKMKMLTQLEQLTTGIGKKHKVSKSVSNYGLAGQMCDITVLGGVNKCIIELVDTYTHTTVLYDLTEKVVKIKPTWDILRFRNTMNKPPEVQPTLLTSTGQPPFPSDTDTATGASSKIVQVNRSAIGAEVVKKAKNEKAAKQDQPTPQTQEQLVSIVEAVANTIMTEIAKYYDNKAGQMLAVGGDTRDEIGGLRKEVAKLKGRSDEDVSKVVNAAVANEVQVDKLTKAMSTAVGDGGVVSRLDKLEEVVKRVEEKADTAITIGSNVQESLANLCGMVKGIQQSNTFDANLNRYLIESPKAPVHAPTNQQLDFSSMAPPLQTNKDLEQFVVVNNSPAHSGNEDLMAQLDRFESSKRRMLPPVDEEGETSLDAATRILNRGMVGNASGGLAGTVWSFINKNRQSWQCNGNVYHIQRLRRIISDDQLSSESGKVQVCTVEEVMFSHPNEQNCEANVNLIEYGILERSVHGTVLRGFRLDTLPRELVDKIGNHLWTLSAATADAQSICRVLRNSLRDYYNHLKLLSNSLPKPLLFEILAEGPSYDKGPKVPNGSLTAMIEGNCEPTASVLRYLKSAMIAVDENVLGACFWEALLDFQRNYNKVRQRQKCKHRNSHLQKRPCFGQLSVAPTTITTSPASSSTGELFPCGSGAQGSGAMGANKGDRIAKLRKHLESLSPIRRAEYIKKMREAVNGSIHPVKNSLKPLLTFH